MSKAVLVMDMPKNCAECNLCGIQDDEIFCIPDDFAHYLSSSYMNHSCESRPDWCPLRELSEKKERLVAANDYDGGYSHGFTHGYNACIDELLKGEEG